MSPQSSEERVAGGGAFDKEQAEVVASKKNQTMSLQKRAGLVNTLPSSKPQGGPQRT
jgi:hypothetical protein